MKPIFFVFYLILNTGCWGENKRQGNSSLGIIDSGSEAAADTRSVLNHPPADNLGELTIRAYCWCFLSQMIKEDSNSSHERELRLCTSTVRFTPKMLSSQRYLWSTTVDSQKTRHLENVIFKKGVYSGRLIRELDSRFLLLVDRSNSRTDTVVFMEPFKFAINGDVYEYPFRLLDSIHYYLDVNKFDCQQ